MKRALVLQISAQASSEVHVVWLRMLATLLEAVRKGFETHLFTSLATIDTFLHSAIYVMSHGFLQIILLDAAKFKTEMERSRARVRRSRDRPHR
jgi:hypothetical protein